MNTSPLLTVEQAAEYLTVRESFVRRLIHEKRIPTVHLGRLVRLQTVDLDAFIAAGREEANDWRVGANTVRLHPRRRKAAAS